MQELDDGGHIHMALAMIARGAGTKDGHQRAQALAAGLDDIVPHLADQRDIGIQVVIDKLVHRREVIFDDSINGLEIHALVSRQKVGATAGNASSGWQLVKESPFLASC